jgi:hypothetical protein
LDAKGIRRMHVERRVTAPRFEARKSPCATAAETAMENHAADVRKEDAAQDVAPASTSTRRRERGRASSNLREPGQDLVRGLQ